MRSQIIRLGGAVLLSGPWLALAAHAAEHPPLTLDQAIELARSANPGLRAVAMGVGIADGARQQAGSQPNPELSVLQEGTQRAGRTRTVQISVPIELGGKRAARVRVAELDRTMADQEWLARSAQLQADVTAAYFDVLAADEQHWLAEGALELATKASAAAGRRVTAGKVSPLAATRADMAVAHTRLELAQAQATSSGARRRLAAMWGSTAMLEQRLVQPAPDATAIPPLAVLEERLNQAPAVKLARSQVDRDAAQVQLELSQQAPNLAVTLGNKKDERGSQMVVGLSVPLPLFNRNGGHVLAAQHRTEQARAQLEAVRLEASVALAEAWQRAQFAQQQAETLKSKILPAAEQAVEAAVTGFELGKFSFLDVLDAQRTLAQTRAQYMTAQSARYRAIADIQRQVSLK